MRERPILFSAPMVRAILNGSKTQTRRVAQTEAALGREALFAHRGKKKHAPTFLLPNADLAAAHCPYGQPGYQLWVRETWRIGAWDDHGGFWLDYCDGPRKGRRECQDVGMAERLIEQTLDDLNKRNVQPTMGGRYEWARGASPLHWRPSIHMPRWASRTTLGIMLDVRKEGVTEDVHAGFQPQLLFLICQRLPERIRRHAIALLRQKQRFVG